MLTGEPLVEPELPPLREDLQSENERFRVCHKARMVLQVIPEDVKLKQIKASRLARTETVRSLGQGVEPGRFRQCGTLRGGRLSNAGISASTRIPSSA